MIEIAIVISAWRRSCPWFQLLHQQADAGDDEDGRERRQHPLREADLRAREAERAAASDHVALDAQRDVAAEQEERAVRHVDDAHQAEDQREPARDDEVQRRRGEPVEQRDQEVLRVVDRRTEARARRDEQDPDDRERDEREQQPFAHAS
jgi:hypothetical protein